MLNPFCAWLIDLLFPPRCPLCRAYTERQGAWCPACYRGTVNVRNAPLDTRHIQHVRRVTVLCNYRGGMKKLIHTLKYRKKCIYLPHMHSLLQEQLEAVSLPRFDWLTPVPLHAHKRKERGFNQTDKIFRPWARQSGFVWEDALERVRDTPAQYELTVRERRDNLRRAFRVKDGAAVQGKRILLLDDIFTTGVTMDECAQALQKAGARSVCGLALASDA